MANVFFHSCRNVLPSCFLFFFVTLPGAQVFRSFCCLQFLFSTFSLFTTVTIRWSLPFSEKSIQRTLLNSMPNCQNLVNNIFEANMDLQHGRSDKVVSRSPHLTQIMAVNIRFDLNDGKNKSCETESKLMQVNNT